MTEKRIVKNNFSKSAPYYDGYSSIQNLCASALLTDIPEGPFKSILEIGCGTGTYTKLLKNRFPEAGISALDISEEMVNIAKEKPENKGVIFIIADGETIGFKEPFDLISSNASFQWFGDLRSALGRYRQFMSDKGMILFSIFGPLTFKELDESLKELSKKGGGISSRGFLNKRGLEEIMESFFKEAKVEEKIYKESFSSLEELLKNIKYSGTRGNSAAGDGFWTPKKMDSLEKIYKKRFRGIEATYQIFFCRGIK